MVSAIWKPLCKSDLIPVVSKDGTERAGNLQWSQHAWSNCHWRFHVRSRVLAVNAGLRRWWPFVELFCEYIIMDENLPQSGRSSHMDWVWAESDIEKWAIWRCICRYLKQLQNWSFQTATDKQAFLYLKSFCCFRLCLGWLTITQPKQIFCSYSLEIIGDDSSYLVWTVLLPGIITRLNTMPKVTLLIATLITLP